MRLTWSLQDREWLVIGNSTSVKWFLGHGHVIARDTGTGRTLCSIMSTSGPPYLLAAAFLD